MIQRAIPTCHMTVSVMCVVMTFHVASLDIELLAAPMIAR